jgi:acetyl esterase/lipase
MALFDYIKLKIQAVFFRTFVSIISFLNPPSRIFYPKSKSIKPTWSTTIPSTSSSRKIRVNIHEPPNLTSSASLPGVHLNFHGSGFVLDMFGGDAEHLTYLAETVGCIVVDGDYAKGPEYPFPAAFNDVNDIVNWAKSNPLGKWDPSKLTIGGYSAGANLAISVTAAALPSKDIKAVVAWYPPIDFPRRDLPSERQRYKEHKPEYPGTDLPKNVTDFFDGCYIGKGDKRDPKISPYLADLTGFPPTFVTVRSHHS